MELTASKRCPECAEEIQAEALVCKHCGFDYRGGARPAEASKTSGMAIAALVLGIVWVYGIGAILALVFGYKAKRDIDRSDGKIGGRGMAIAGIVLGWVGIGGIIAIVLLIALGASAAETFQQCIDYGINC